MQTLYMRKMIHDFVLSGCSTVLADSPFNGMYSSHDSDMIKMADQARIMVV